MKLAVLFGCQLEGGYDNFFKLFDKQFPDDYDIFIYTNKSCNQYLKYFKSDRIKVCKYVEDDISIQNIENQLEQEVRKNQRIFQWLKLKKCYELMEQYQKDNNITYDYVYKLRMPKNRKSLKTPFNLPQNIQKDEIYCVSDMYFIGQNKTMDKVCRLYDYLYDMLYGYENNQKYWKTPCNSSSYPPTICGGLYGDKPIKKDENCQPGFDCRRVGFFCSSIN